MKKKLLSLALVLAMALTLLPTAAFATIAHGNLEGGGQCTDTNTVWKEANGKHMPACATCGVVDSDDTQGHDPTPSSDYTQQNGKHWKTCTGGTNCTIKLNEGDCAAASTPEYKKDGTAHTHQLICDTCKKPYGDITDCSADKADYTHTGTTHSFECKVCGQQYTNVPCTNASDLTAAACDGCGYRAPHMSSVAATFTATKATVVVSVGDAVTDTKVSVTLNKGGKKAEGVSNNPAEVAISNGTGTAEFTLSGAASTDEYTVDVQIKDVTGSLNKINGTEVEWHGTDTPTTPTTPTTPETPKEEEKAPSTNSQGVPVASEVNTVKQANQAIDTLKQTNPDTMADKLMTNDTASSSYASLDRAVADAKGISTGVEKQAGLPSVVNNGTVGIVGAALNASSSVVRLVVDVPSKSYTATAGYQISMTMTGVSNAAKLAVPVIITLPLPSDVQPGRVVVLHYHSGSTPTVIIPSVSGNTLRFAVTGFSDFVITDYGDVEANGTSGFYTVVQGGGNRIDPNAMDDATLAAIASLASGDVFTDVLANHWAADQIRWARNQNLMGGYEDGSFHPTAATTRQQLWMVLARMDGTFPATMADARAWAINTGVSDGSNPTGVLSRQQLVTMLYRFAQSKGKDVTASTALSAYADGAKVAPYAKDALAWAAAKGIVTGSNGKLNPENTATRAHFAVFLSRYSATVI